MIPELNEYQNRRVVNEKITLPFGCKWLSWTEYGEGKRTIPKGAKYLNMSGIWEDDDNAGGWWMNKSSIICVPVYPTIPNGYKLVMQWEKIEKGYKYYNISCDESWEFDSPKNGLVGETYYPKDWGCQSVDTFFINPIVSEVKPEIALSDKVHELEAENATLKETMDILRKVKRNLSQDNAELVRARNQRSLEFTTLRNRNDELTKELSNIKDAWQKLSDLFKKNS